MTMLAKQKRGQGAYTDPSYNDHSLLILPGNCHGVPSREHPPQKPGTCAHQRDGRKRFHLDTLIFLRHCSKPPAGHWKLAGGNSLEHKQDPKAISLMEMPGQQMTAAASGGHMLSCSPQEHQLSSAAKLRDEGVGQAAREHPQKRQVL